MILGFRSSSRSLRSVHRYLPTFRYNLSVNTYQRCVDIPEQRRSQKPQYVAQGEWANCRAKILGIILGIFGIFSVFTNVYVLYPRFSAEPCLRNAVIVAYCQRHGNRRKWAANFPNGRSTQLKQQLLSPLPQRDVYLRVCLNPLVISPALFYRMWLIVQLQPVHCVHLANIHRRLVATAFIHSDWRNAVYVRMHILHVYTILKLGCWCEHAFVDNNVLTHWGRGHLNCLNARYRGF